MFHDRTAEHVVKICSEMTNPQYFKFLILLLFYFLRLAGQNEQHHKPPEVLKSPVFCFWSAGGILTAQATLTQRAWISTFIVDLRAEKIAAKFVMVGLPAEDNIR